MNRTARRRALHAARAVTLGGIASLPLASCTARGAVEDDDRSDEHVQSAQEALQAQEGSSAPPGDGEGSGAPRPTGITATPVGADDGVRELPTLSAADQDGSGIVLTGLEELGGSGDGVACSKERDGVCPSECNRDDDADCCENPENGPRYCNFHPDYGCACAVEGPFAPPSFGV